MAALLAHPTAYTRDEDLIGLAWHLADLAGDDWRTVTPQRRAHLVTLAQLAASAAKETRDAAGSVG